MISKEVTWLFFDLGNTLINESKAEELRIKSIQDVCKKIGIDISIEFIKKQIEKASADYAPNIIKAAVRNIVNDEKAYLLVMDKVKYLKELEEPYYDTYETLKKFRNSYHIGIIANQSLGTEARLKSYGLWSFIDLCLASAEIGIKKPDPEIFMMALDKAGCKAENAVMIGDRLDNDIFPAKKLGFKTIHILRGFGKVQVAKSKEYEPDYRINELKDLAKILKV